MASTDQVLILSEKFRHGEITKQELIQQMANLTKFSRNDTNNNHKHNALNSSKSSVNPSFNTGSNPLSSRAFPAEPVSAPTFNNPRNNNPWGNTSITSAPSQRVEKPIVNPSEFRFQLDPGYKGPMFKSSVESSSRPSSAGSYSSASEIKSYKDQYTEYLKQRQPSIPSQPMEAVHGKPNNTQGPSYYQPGSFQQSNNNHNSRPAIPTSVPTSNGGSLNSSIGSSSHSYAALSNEERRNLIKKLVEEKRVEYENQQRLNNAQPKDNSRKVLEFKRLENKLVKAWVDPEDSKVNQMMKKSGSNPPSRPGTGGARPSSASVPKEQPKRAKTPSKSLPTSRRNSVSKPTAPKREPKFKTPEEQIDYLKKKYQKLPKHNNDEFFRKSTSWKQQKEQKQNSVLSEKRGMREQEEERECTFQPKINPPPKDPFILSFKAKKERVPLTERVYERQQQIQIREAERRMKEEQEYQLTCSFKPKTNVGKSKSRDTSPVRSKYMDSYRSHNSSTQEISVAPENSANSFYPYESSQKYSGQNPELTFHPKINKISQSMEMAQLYAELSPWERLNKSKTIQTGLHEILKPFEDSETSTRKRPLSASVRSMSASSLAASRPQSQSGRPSLTRRMSSGAISRPSSRSTNESFQKFWKRQEDLLKHKEEHREVIKAEVDGVRPPLFCKKSLAIGERRGSFAERLEQDLKKRKNNQTEAELTMSSLESKNGKPQILSTSKRMRSRSWAEMSTGDQMRREALQEAARQKAWHDELKGATFKPEITEVPGVRGKLNVLQDPHSYLRRVKVLKEQQQIREYITQQVDVLREQDEVKECTFQPQIREAPDFVKRIARSISQTKKPAPALQPTPYFKFT